MAQAEFGGEGVAAVTVLDERGLVPARVLDEVGGAVHAVLVPVGADQQLVAVAQAQGVHPARRVAVGVELGWLGQAEVVGGVAFVLGVADVQAAAPDVVDPAVEVAGEAAELEVHGW
ncbi:hypothetical protein D9M70_620190 [compost metagenome]